MRFSYQVGMSDANHYLPLAKAAEAAGYDGITIPDSICYPQECSSKYPYNKDGSREFLESVPFLESLIAVSAMAAVTDTIRFATFVYKLAVRQAPVVAKQVQSISSCPIIGLISVWVLVHGKKILRFVMFPGSAGENALTNSWRS